MGIMERRTGKEGGREGMKEMERMGCGCAPTKVFRSQRLCSTVSSISASLLSVKLRAAL